MLLAALGPIAPAAVYVVDNTADGTNSTPSSGTGTIGDPYHMTSLRGAVLHANANGAGPHTINVPAGTYNLSATNPSTPATTATNGFSDLQVGSHLSTVTITGTGGTPLIHQTIAGTDVITTGFKADLSPAVVNLTLNNLEITGGGFTGIFTGADDGTNRSSTTITNCNIHNNTNADASFGQGGAIQNAAGSLTVTNSTFANNSATNAATGQGGAIYFNLPSASGPGSQGDLTITGCTFTSNTASVGAGFPAGGAVFVSVLSSGTAISITGNNFVSNSATSGSGGAIALLNTTRAANINFNRFISNTATSGSVLSANTSTVNANGNWWSRNTGPDVNEITGSAVTAATWLQLKLTALAATVPASGSTTLTASFLSDSANGAVSPANLTALVGKPVSFNGGAFGSISGSQTSIQAAGTATASFDASATAGLSNPSAIVDNASASVGVTVTGSVTLNTGNLLQSAPTITINGTGFSTTLANNSVAFSSGAGNVTGATTTSLAVTFTTPPATGSLTAVVTTNSVSSGAPVQVATVIMAGPPDHLAFDVQPTNSVAGVAISPAVTVRILDSNGVQTNSTANVTLVIGTNPGGGTLSGTTTVAAVNGVATFSNLSINKAGTGYTLAASGTVTGATSGTFNITPAAVSALSVSAPVSTNAGAPFGTTVSATDQFGNVVASYTGTVHFTSTDAGGGVALPADYTFTAGDNGVHTFTNGVTLVTAGAQTLTATDTGNGTISGAANVTVLAGAATHLVVTAPATTLPNAAFGVTVAAKDAFNNTTTGYTGTVHFTKTDSAGGSAVPADYTFVAGDNGVHTFTNGVTLVTGGSQTVTATDTVNGAVTGSANVTVMLPPSIAAAFSPAQVVANTLNTNPNTTLTYTITNPNAVPLTGVGFTQTLPVGLTVASGTATVGGGTRTLTSPNTISLTGATVPANGQLVFGVPVTGATVGVYNNVTTGAVTSANGGTGNTATANTLTVVGGPTVAVAFGTATFGTGELTTLTYTVTNPNTTVALTGLAFNDVLPAGLVVAKPNTLVNNLGGTATAVAGTNVVSLADGTIAAGATATLTVNITALTPGVKTGMFTVLTSTEVPAQTTSATPVPSNSGISTLTFARQIFTGTVDASDPTQTGRMNRFAVVSTIAAPKAFPGNFTTTGARHYDSYTIANTTGSPQGVNVWFNTSGTNGFVAAYLDSYNPTSLGTNYLADAGSSWLGTGSFGFTIPAGHSAVIVVHEVNPDAGFNYVLGINTPIPPDAAGVAALPSVTVIPKPFLVQDFVGPYIPVNTATPLTFRLINTGPSAFTNVSFTETLPAGLTIATPNGFAGSVGGGTLTANAGSSTISFAGATVPANSHVQFTLNVIATTLGTKILTSSPVTSTEAGSGGFSYSCVDVVAPPLLSMSFNPAQIPIGGTSSLDFTIVNPAGNAIPLTGVGFTLTLPAGLTVPDSVIPVGGGSLFTNVPTSILLSGATVPLGGQLQFSVNVTAPGSGAFNATTGPVTSVEGGSGLAATATLTTNLPPVAGPFTIVRYPTQPVKVTKTQIVTLGSVSDPDAGDTVSVQSVGTPANGTAVISGNFVFYTPNTGFTGADSFTYTVADNHGATATSTISVAIVTDNAATNNIARFTKTPGGPAEVDFIGIPNFSYGIQYSATLTPSPTWVNIGSITMNSVGSAHFSDTDPVRMAAPQGYYRFIYPAP